MFYEIYKKQIWITIFGLLLLVIILITFLFKGQDSKIVKDIDIKVSSGSIKFEDSKLADIKGKYDYYQVYLYPETFDITCSSVKKEFCDNVEKNKNTFKDNVIWFFGHDLTKWNAWEVEVKTYFSESDVDTGMLKDIFIQMQISSDFIKTPNADILKYFEYKKENNPNSEIIVNDMEIICFEGIKSSIPEWTFDEENIIKDRVKNECSGFADISPIDVAFGWINKDDDAEITMWVTIKELKVLYKFFVKEWLEFKEKSKEQKIIKTDIKTSSKFKLSEILSF